MILYIYISTINSPQRLADQFFIHENANFAWLNPHFFLVKSPQMDPAPAPNQTFRSRWTGCTGCDAVDLKGPAAGPKGPKLGSAWRAMASLASRSWSLFWLNDGIIVICWHQQFGCESMEKNGAGCELESRVWPSGRKRMEITKHYILGIWTLALGSSKMWENHVKNWNPSGETV